MKPKQLHLLLFLLVALGSCGYVGNKRVKGNGVSKTEMRTVSSFNRVKVSGAADVVLRQDSSFSVKVEGDENLLPYIEVGNEGNTLWVSTRNGYNLRPRTKLIIYVSAPAYSDISVSGAGEIRSENKLVNTSAFNFDLTGAGEIKLDVDAPKIDVDISGAGNIQMKGKTRDLDLQVSGAGDVNCFDLQAENTNLDITGAGNADVYASVKLSGQVSGAGNVRYKGGGASEVRTTGAGSLKKVD